MKHEGAKFRISDPVSEQHLERELKDSGVRGCSHMARGSADRRARRAEGAIGEVRVRIGPLRVVKQVEELGAELEAESFVGWHRIEVLEQAGVHIPERGAGPIAFAGVAVLSIGMRGFVGNGVRYRWDGEHRLIEPGQTMNTRWASGGCPSAA